MLLGKIPIQLKSRISCPSIDMPRLFRDPCFFCLNFNVGIPTLGKLFNVDQEKPELIERSLFCSNLEQLFCGTSIRQRRLLERGV